ncbi:MAG: hypothetical protein DMF06_10320 [Verrucomicrobia bacterium]|nr:MAG: hypothetical protein DMF06_10320 [Verrucomicrobiota bacterium]
MAALHHASVNENPGGNVIDAGAKGDVTIDREASYCDNTGALNIEDVEIRPAQGFCHRQQIRAGSVDRDVLIDAKRTAGDDDTLAVKRGIEINRVPVTRRGDRSAERPRAAVGRGGNGDCGCAKVLRAGHYRAQQREELQPASSREAAEG